jgi:hypothetical protein
MTKDTVLSVFLITRLVFEAEMMSGRPIRYVSVRSI